MSTLVHDDAVCRWLADEFSDRLAGPDRLAGDVAPLGKGALRATGSADVCADAHADACADAGTYAGTSLGTSLGTRPFVRFGWRGETIDVVRPGAGLRLIRWLALHAHESDDRHSAWEECRRAHPECFQTFHTNRLERPSFFLPAGENVFEAIANPTQIPDAPRRGVLLRHWEAMTAEPEATFYFLRPVFTYDGDFRLFSATELREESAVDRDNALFAARLYGPAIRAGVCLRASLRGLLNRATRSLRSATEWWANFLAPTGRRRAAQALRDVDASRLPQGRSVAMARAFDEGAANDADAFRRAVAFLADHVTVDPILCFEVDHRPGELWFEANWYEGADGRRYVHF